MTVKKFFVGLGVFLLSFGLYAGAGYFIYYKQFKFPPKEVIVHEETRLYALEQGIEEIRSSSTDYQLGILKYNTGYDSRINLVKKIGESVSFTVSEVQVLNKYGEVYKDPSGDTLTRNSVLSEGETIKVKVPDFTKIDISQEDIANLESLSSLDLEYGSKLEGYFVDFLLNKELPTREVTFLPKFEYKEGTKKGKGSYILTNESKIELLGLIFNIKDFEDLERRYAEATIQGKPNPDWVYWSELPSSDKGPEPKSTLSKETISSFWLRWNAAPNKSELDEPNKFLSYFYMSPNFILKNENSRGTGTIDSQFPFNVPIRTYFLQEDVKIPVQVNLNKMYYDVDAIKFLELQDSRNRGLYSKSNVKFYVLEYTLENLSPFESIKGTGVFGFSDKQGNITARTGTMYGLQELENFIELKPGEKKDLVFWVNGVDLENKNLIWGKNFKAKEDIVFFNKSIPSTSNNSDTTDVSE